MQYQVVFNCALQAKLASEKEVGHPYTQTLAGITFSEGCLVTCANMIMDTL